ncbi:PREDICTED: SUMO-activating enzyme subunit 1, partial [Tauraco erythrolophus]|uniref:SUMO-activating enzyme subunit 1 n=1 Tax=Tauraco erythrolophus TaxID=121530 RepID=UPI00052317B9
DAEERGFPLRLRLSAVFSFRFRVIPTLLGDAPAEPSALTERFCRRLRASRVLLVGMKGLGAEVAKNLILAGVKGLTMLDHQQVSQEDTRAQFLIPAGSLGEASLERAQNLNPMVDVKADPESAESKPEEFFTQFDA